MITLNAVVTRTPGLEQQELERWIVENWVRPEQEGGEYLFHDVDVARVELILELRHELDIDEVAIPLVLSLLDQVYDLRRRMRQLGEALSEIAPDDVQRALAEHLARQRGPARRL